MLSKPKSKRLMAVAAAICVAAVGGAGLADAASTKHHRQAKRHATDTSGTRAGAETELTGDTAQQAKEAALAATGGGTAWRASKEDPNDPSGAAYEVHVTKTDGSEVEVLEDSSFKVIKTQASPQHGGPQHG